MSAPWLDPALDEVHRPEPYDYEGAKRAEARGSRDQAGAGKWTTEAFSALGEAEKVYRVALAKQMVKEVADGAAKTTASDLARGNEHVADLRLKRDIAEGVKEAALQNAWRCNANRKALGRLINWSRGVAPDGQTEER